MSEDSIRVEGYTVKRELGRGGMATVYLAVQESFDREVALKVMSEQLVADSTFAERFLREARIVAHLAHPHIVSVYDVGVSDGHFFLAMELHTGGDLASRIVGGITHPQIVDILKQVSGALHYAHAAGYVHRDIKPGNVLFSHHGHAVLTDFGIAKAADSSTDLTQVKRVVGRGEMTKEGAIIGTPSYMSPEQARGQAVDGRADIYSLGIMLYEMLTRRVPYKASDPFAVAIMHINEPLPKLPPEHAVFQPVLEKLLAKEPGARFQTGAQLIEALDGLSRKLAVRPPSPEELRTMVVHPGEVPASARRPGQRRLQLAGAAAAVLAAGAAGLYFALSPSSPEPLSPSDNTATTSPAANETGTLSDEEGAPGAGEVVPAALTATAPPSPADAARIAQLLEEAQVAIQQNQLSSPPGDNALEKYARIFEIDPGNKAAREGQVQVADRYLALTKDAVRDRKVHTARRYVDKVKEFAPAHPELASAQRLVTEAERAATVAPKNELRIMGLLGQARIAMGDGRLTEPKGSSAYDKYRAVLAIDPNHQQALEGVQKIAGRYLQLAASEVQKRNFTKADEYLARAESIAPRHPGLAAARASARQARVAAGS
jgi:serine/threonine protein kinase